MAKKPEDCGGMSFGIQKLNRPKFGRATKKTSAPAKKGKK